MQRVGPRKLLTLDGGGIRGMMSVEILAEIEQILRERSGGDEQFVLADYFDYIAGTSTGAIIATCLSLGWSVAKLRSFYVTRGGEMFDKASILRRFRYKFDDGALSDLLKEEFGATTTLGSDDLHTLLMIVLRNATTDSPWPLSNNPQATYNQRHLPDCNLDLPLWQLVRASTAAPTFFPPETVKLGDKSFVFVDGGITMYNNPAFQLFLMSTIEPYKLQWLAGENNMLIVSVGTGTAPQANSDLRENEMNLLFNAGSIPSALMFAALNEQDLLCRVFGNCLQGDQLDAELGSLLQTPGPCDKLFTYVRYNAEFSQPALAQLGVGGIDPKKIQALDSLESIADLQLVGKAVANTKVSAKHFDNFV